MAKRTDYGLQVDYVFRGTEHVVRMTTEGNLLEVEVEDRLTTDQWRGEFDAAFIEDLTHKTGNFKQFGIFCSMLESALAQVRHESTSSTCGPRPCTVFTFWAGVGFQIVCYQFCVLRSHVLHSKIISHARARNSKIALGEVSCFFTSAEAQQSTLLRESA
uniref:Coiled-coil domain containing 61 n=1 Tax=Naja naja TaxID=35670 RepID=A0A8C6Y9M3_NAJNA